MCQAEGKTCLLVCFALDSLFKLLINIEADLGGAMTVDRQELAPCKERVVIEVPSDEVDEEYAKAYQDLRQRVNVPGFRRGKAPISVVRARFKDYVTSRLLEEFLPKVYEEALKGEDLNVVGEPSFEEMVLDEGKPLRIEMTVEVHPRIELKRYTGFTIVKEDVQVTEEEVDRKIDDLRSEHATFEERAEGAEEGDVLIIDYQVYQGEARMEEKSEEGIAFTLGGERTMPVFNEALKGARPGDEVEIPVTLPDNYVDPDLAGRDVTFAVTVKEVKRMILPELNQEFFSKMGVGSEDELRQRVREQLQREKDEMVWDYMVSQLKAHLLAIHDFPVPPSLVESGVKKVLDDVKMRFRVMGMDPEEPGAITDEMRREAERKVRRDVQFTYLIHKIADREEVKVGDDEIREKLEKVADELKMPVERVVEWMDKAGRLDAMALDILERKTIEHIFARCRLLTPEQARAQARLATQRFGRRLRRRTCRR